MKKIFLIILTILFVGQLTTEACTTAVISGKATKDGRPLLWKHRDTWATKNKIMQFNDGKYSYIGLVNSGDKTGKSIWIGHNSAGFAIMNSASYNLNNDTIEQTGLEGQLMKKALQTCATVDEFEQFLKNLPQPSRLEANFGVIDAQGGAAEFELANFHYVKFDANDPKQAPNGYLVRTNYSISGLYGKGGGYTRYRTAEETFYQAIGNNDFDVMTIVQGASRNLTHSLTKENLWDYINIPEGNPKYVCLKDFIPRSGSASSITIQGVKKDESPSLTTMWAIVGFPLTSVCIPLWLDMDTELPEIVQYDKELKDSPICHAALTFKKDVYSYRLGSHSKYYINVNSVLNANGSGYLQKLRPLEEEIYQKGLKMKETWYENNKLNRSEIKSFYEWLDTEISSYYQSEFSYKLLNN